MATIAPRRTAKATTQFSARHYRVIASVLGKVIASDRSLFTKLEITKVSERLCKVFAADNSRFNRERFIAAIESAAGE